MPKTVNVNFRRLEETREHLKTIQSVLNSGGVIAFPTDTYYGLGANPTNAEAVDRVFFIKRRPFHKPILVLAASRRQLNDLVEEIAPDAEKLIQTLWPGPITLLFKASPRLPGNLTAGTGKIGVRLPANGFASKLIARIGHPLTASSANISGSKNIQTARGARQALGASVDLIVDGGPAPGGKESSVLDATLSPPLLLREGAVAKEEIEAVLNKPICVQLSAVGGARN